MAPIKGGKFWLCQCDCGNTGKASKWHILRKLRQSCGCRLTEVLPVYQCRSCGVPKPLGEFYLRTNGHLNEQVCQTCTKMEMAQQGRAYLAKLRLGALNHYGNDNLVCSCCGDTHAEFLQLDHVGGGGTEHRRRIKKEGQPNMYRWLFQHGYPNLPLRVLCANCNFALGAFSFCPHHGSISPRIRPVPERYDGDEPARRCGACGVKQRLTDFYTRPSRSDKQECEYVGCKTCLKYRTGPQRTRTQKIAALERYGGRPPKCRCCGETHLEFLHLDHIDGSGGEHRRRIKEEKCTGIYRWLAKHQYPDLPLQVLCANCNYVKSRHIQCPHQACARDKI